jgi:hypothetical protein
MDLADGRFAEPALAAHLADRRGLVRDDCIGEFLAQVKIAADTFVVEAIEPEHGLGVLKVDRVFDFAALGDTFGVEVSEIHRQGLQFREHLRKAARLSNALALLLTVFRSGPDFLVMHNIAILPDNLSDKLGADNITDFCRRL